MRSSVLAQSRKFNHLGQVAGELHGGFGNQRAPLRLRLMARFYFNLYNDTVTIDDEGVELADLAAAELQARTAASQIIAERIAEGNRINPNHRIEVEDEQRHVVITLRFSMLIEQESDGD
jgi:hypothetical protein